MENFTLISLLSLAQNVVSFNGWEPCANLNVSIDWCDGGDLSDVLIEIPEGKSHSATVILTDNPEHHLDASEFVGKYVDLTENDVGKNPKDIPVLDVE
jgi:hypothetical protein